jgi:hypothetical protein
MKPALPPHCEIVREAPSHDGWDIFHEVNADSAMLKVPDYISDGGDPTPEQAKPIQIHEHYLDAAVQTLRFAKPWNVG